MSTKNPMYLLIIHELTEYERLVSRVDSTHRYLEDRKSALHELEDKTHSWKRIFKKQVHAAAAAASADVEEARQMVEHAEEQLVKVSKKLDEATAPILAEHMTEYRIGIKAREFLNSEALQPVIDALETFRPNLKIMHKTLGIIRTSRNQDYIQYAQHCLKRAILAAREIDQAITAYNLHVDQHRDAVAGTSFRKVQLPKFSLTEYDKRLLATHTMELDNAERILVLIENSVSDHLQINIPMLLKKIQVAVGEHDTILKAMVRHAWTSEWIRWRELPKSQRFANMLQAG